MKRACLGCGAITTGRRCPHCDGGGTGWSHNRDPGKQREFRKALLARSGGRCEEIDERTGRRCTATTDLRACHVVALADAVDWDLSNGRMRCGHHDRLTDPKAR